LALDGFIGFIGCILPMRGDLIEAIFTLDGFLRLIFL